MVDANKMLRFGLEAVNVMCDRPAHGHSWASLISWKGPSNVRPEGQRIEPIEHRIQEGWFHMKRSVKRPESPKHNNLKLLEDEC